MTMDELMKVHRAQPFRPYAIRLADGRKLRVRRNENLGRSPHGTEVSVAVGRDSFEFVRIGQIVDIETTNGRQRTRTRRKP